MDSEEASEFCESIFKVLNEIPEPGWDFVESVRSKVEGIQDDILAKDRVTDDQLTALENMKAGAEKWLR